MENILNEEIYYDIKGYEGLYQINYKGVIKSIGKWYGGKDFKFLKIGKCLGYDRICLCKNNIKKHFSIHRLIALHFIPNDENKPFINHKNGIRNDNKLENLEWCTHSENMQHASKVLGHKGSFLGKFGKDAPGFGISRLANLPIRKVKCDTLDIEFPSITQACRALGLSSGNISQICKGIRKHTQGLSFRYL